MTKLLGNKLEQWSGAVLEYWVRMFLRGLSHHSSAPILHHSTSLARYPAVDVDGLAGDEVAQRRGEEEHGADDVLRQLDSFQRSRAHRRFTELDHLLGGILFGE